jgi:O-antigen ligase
MANDVGTLWAGAPLNALQAALLLLILCMVWRLQNLFPVLTPLQLSTLSMAGASLLPFVSNDPRQRPSGAKHPIVWIVLLILVLSVASVPTSVYPGKSFSFVLNDFSKTVLLMVLVVLSLRNINDARRLIATQAIGASLYAFIAVTKFQTDASGRLGELLYYDANDLAMVLVCTLPFLLYIVVTMRGWLVKLGTAAGFGLIMLAVIRAGSRGGFIALAAITVFLLFRFGSVRPAKRIGFVAVLAGAFVLTATDATWNQLKTLTNPDDDYNMTSETGRKAVWTRGIGYMMQRPLFGVGVSCFVEAEGRLSALAKERAEAGRGLKWSAAHNSFVQIGAELGFPGLIAFTGVLLLAFRTVAQIRKRFPDPTEAHSRARGLCDAIMACLIGYCIAGFFLSQAFGAYIYLILGLIVGLDKVTRPALSQPTSPTPTYRFHSGGARPRPTLQPRPVR